MPKNERPSPPIPPDIDLRDYRFMPLDIIQLHNSDTWSLATGWEAKALINLWCRAWHQVPAGSLPDNDDLLNLWSGVPNWDDVRDVVRNGFVMCNDGRLYHLVICEKAMKSWKENWVNKNRTRAATKARAEKKRQLTPRKQRGKHKQRDVIHNDVRDVVRDVDSKSLQKEKEKEKKERKKDSLPARPPYSNPPCIKHSANSKNSVKVNKADNVDKTDAAIKPPALKSVTYEKAHVAAPGYDIYFIEEQWISSGFAAKAKNPDTAFLGFVRKHVKGNPL